ncbi:MAG: hypothetical protein CBB97_08005, partial [Candidatus Endolissoclinum sp. TMED37]
LSLKNKFNIDILINNVAIDPKGMQFLKVLGISQISNCDYEKWGNYWKFTDLSLSKLLLEKF